jgi:uncharacterized protein (DUF885 family)
MVHGNPVTGCRECLDDRAADAARPSGHEYCAISHRTTLASGLPPRKGRMLCMPEMPQSPQSTQPASPRPVRDIADVYVQRRAELDTLLATFLGLPIGQDRLPDFSPAGEHAEDALVLETLARLTEAEAGVAASGGFTSDDERRCARLLRERLQTEHAITESGEGLRTVSNIFGPPSRVRGSFLLMPAATAEDWAVVGRRMAAIPEAFASYREALTAGAARGMYAAPRQVRTVAEQLAAWQSSGGKGWFTGFAAAADGPGAMRADLDAASAAADAAVTSLRDWLLSDYLPRTEGTPDGVGPERYRIVSRQFLGASPDLTEAYEWAWSQFHEISAEMEAEAAGILPGSTPREAMTYLDEHSEVVEGVDEIRFRLQGLMDQAMGELDGTHFDLADPIKVVEARIAPPGSAAAPYYTGPSQDFSRPGRTWLPTMGKTSFPLWGLYSTWYHEGVPGHHLQIAQWRYLSDQLSVYQTSAGVSACSEGWALYAERLMDELGYLEPHGARMGYLDAQLMRAIRVIIDIGMHLELTIPADAPMFAGEVWTPELALDFFDANNGRGREFLESEVARYLSAPGQAISYKLGERAWLAGRDAARSARGASFDLKAWHMASLSLGVLGLDDLADELGRL